MTKRIDQRVGLPLKQGLYDPTFEKDACGVGFVAHIKGKPSHQIMQDAYFLNSRMDHRGGCGFEENTGDGAGVLTAIPDQFFRAMAESAGLKLPAVGQYAVGNCFLPTDPSERADAQSVIERILEEEQLDHLLWREVPIDPMGADVGPAARDAMPAIIQLLIAATLIWTRRHSHASYLLQENDLPMRFARMQQAQAKSTCAVSRHA